jgi:Family of unknown function (DUF6788)
VAVDEVLRRAAGTHGEAFAHVALAPAVDMSLEHQAHHFPSPALLLDFNGVEPLGGAEVEPVLQVGEGSSSGGGDSFQGRQRGGVGRHSSALRNGSLSTGSSTRIILIDTRMPRPKTVDLRRQEQLRQCRSEYARLKARLREVGFICEGSLVERWMQCGKPNCACTSDPASLHGPYFQLSWKEKGKTVSRRLSVEHAALYRQWIANRQRLQSIIQTMHRVSRKARRHLLHSEKSRNAAAKTGDITP